MKSYVSSVISVHKPAETTAGPSETKRTCFGTFGRIMGEMFDVSLLKSPTFIIVCVSGFIVYLGEDNQLHLTGLYL
jgi:hypothetical protein